MSKMKWRKADYDLLAKVVRQFNAKITRVSKKNPTIASVQPEKINAKQIAQELQGLPRREFSRKVHSLQRYLKGGSEMPYTTQKGVNITLWQRREIQILERTRNIQLSYARKRTTQKYDVGMKQSVREAALQPKKSAVEAIEPKNFETYFRSLQRQVSGSRKQQYKENFLKAYETMFGRDTNLTILKALDTETLVNFYYSSRYVRLDFIYDPLQEHVIKQAINEELASLIKENGLENDINEALNTMIQAGDITVQEAYQIRLGYGMTNAERVLR